MPNDFKQGASLGRYEIIRKLAVGGMAEIYLARVRGTAGFEKLVVLKRISPHVAEDQGFVQMFLDEARLAATLRHPNIADVFDVGAEDNSYYFAMEFIHGQDARSIRLAAYELDREVPLEVALAIVYGTTYALGYAHAKAGPGGPLGIVHRDVSPSNILVSYDGAVKLVDFGIARAETRTSVKTRTGMLKGKVPYMSPEQTRGQVLDRRSDIFSLGTVLYELTCGKRPFEGHSEYDTLEAIVSGRCEPPSVHAPNYPPELERIVLRMLARDPGDRYQTADDVLADLEKLFSDAGLLVSERVVAKYMREVFADEIAEWERAQAMSSDPPTTPEELPFAGTATGSGEIGRPHSPTTPWGMRIKRSELSLELTPNPVDAVDPTREYPNDQVPDQLLSESPTAEVRLDANPDESMQPLLVTPEVQVFVRSPRPTSPPPPQETTARGGPDRPPSSPRPPTAPARAPTPPPAPLPTRPTHWPRVPMPDRASGPVRTPVNPTPVVPTTTQPVIKHPDFHDESPTSEPTLQEERGRSRRPRQSDFIDESPTMQSPRAAAARMVGDALRTGADQTRLDSLLGFDPILARGDELLDEIDADAPANETDEERAIRRIGELGARIGAWLDAGDAIQAIVAAELALEENAAGALARRALDTERPTLQAAFDAYLGALDRPVRLGRAPADLGELGESAAALVGGVNGTSTLAELLETPGLSAFEAARWLCWLLLRKMIVPA